MLSKTLGGLSVAQVEWQRSSRRHLVRHLHNRGRPQGDSADRGEPRHESDDGRLDGSADERTTPQRLRG